MTLAMIMAMDRNRLIGKDNGLPWHLSADLKYFKRVTMGKPIIMGRKTFDSIGRPLPGRTNIVVTQNSSWQHLGCLVAPDLATAIALAEQHKGDADEIMIIGGASLCQEAMPQVQKLYLTLIDHEFEGDTWLDSYQPNEWAETERQNFSASDEVAYPYSFIVLQRQ